MQEESIKVAVRVRPSEESCIQVDHDGKKLTIEKISNTLKESHDLRFDAVFDGSSTQSDVFSQILPLVNDALNGYNVTIFAFGMTGSGKTHTISGIMPSAVNSIFSQLQTKANTMTDSLAMVFLTYVELYNGNLYDLLSPDNIDGNSNLKIHEHPTSGIYITGSPTIRSPVGSAPEALQLIQQGNKKRSTSTTLLNERSSRSHSVLTLEIVLRSVSDEGGVGGEFPLSSAGGRAQTRIGKINLVDLAGSERVKLSGAEGQTLIEAKQINQSLSALGDVLNILSKYHADRSHSHSQSQSHQAQLSSPSPSVHIPYRNSKLTMLLKDSLGGNAKTMMICTVHASPQHYAQSLISLRYAARARDIKCTPILNTISDGAAGGGGLNSSMGASPHRLGRAGAGGGTEAALPSMERLAEVSRLKEQLRARTIEAKALKEQVAEMQRQAQAQALATSAPNSSGGGRGGGRGGGPDSKEVKEAVAKLERLHEASAKARTQLRENLRFVIHSQGDKLAVLEQMRSDQADEVLAAVTSRQQTEAHNSQLTRRVEQQQQEISRLLQDCSDAQHEAALMRELASKATEGGLTPHDRSEFVDAIQKLSASRNKHKAKAFKLEEDKKELVTRLAERESQVERLKASLAAESDAVRCLRADLAERQARLTREEAAHARSREEAKGLEVAIVDLTKERDNIAVKLKQLQLEHDLLLHDYRDLERAVSDKDAAHAEAVSRFRSSADVTIDNLRESSSLQSQTSLREIEHLRSLISQHQSQERLQGRRIAEMTQQTIDLQSSLASASQEATQQRVASKNLLEEVVTLQLELESSRRSEELLQEERQTNTSLRLQVQQLQGLLTDAQSRALSATLQNPSSAIDTDNPIDAVAAVFGAESHRSIEQTTTRGVNSSTSTPPPKRALSVQVARVERDFGNISLLSDVDTLSLPSHAANIDEHFLQGLSVSADSSDRNWAHALGSIPTHAGVSAHTSPRGDGNGTRGLKHGASKDAIAPTASTSLDKTLLSPTRRGRSEGGSGGGQVPAWTPTKASMSDKSSLPTSSPFSPSFTLSPDKVPSPFHSPSTSLNGSPFRHLESNGDGDDQSQLRGQLLAGSHGGAGVDENSSATQRRLRQHQLVTEEGGRDLHGGPDDPSTWRALLELTVNTERQQLLQLVEANVEDLVEAKDGLARLRDLARGGRNATRDVYSGVTGANGGGGDGGGNSEDGDEDDYAASIKGERAHAQHKTLSTASSSSVVEVLEELRDTVQQLEAAEGKIFDLEGDNQRLRLEVAQLRAHAERRRRQDAAVADSAVTASDEWADQWQRLQDETQRSIREAIGLAVNHVKRQSDPVASP